MRSEKTYDSIHTLPVKNYDLYKETGKNSYLEEDGKEKDINYSKIFEKIEDEIIDSFGLSTDIIQTEKTKNRILCLELEKIGKEGSELGRINNRIKAMQRELSDFDKANVIKSTLSKNLLQIGISLKMQLDPKTVTVAEYIDYYHLSKEHGNK